MLATVLLSHSTDGAAEVTWPWRNVDAVLATLLLNHVGDGAVEVIWLRCDVHVE
jgi:hypothetical protein